MFTRNCKECGRELNYATEALYKIAEKNGKSCRPCATKNFHKDNSENIVFYKTQITQKIINRFWSKVDIQGKDDCWNWLAGKHIKDGYGKFSLRKNNKTITYVSSRLSYLFYYGELNDNLLVCHTCDNPMCVNPNHLFEGTESDNQQDCVKKGRRNSAHGEQRSNLTQENVDEIRYLVENGAKQIDVARKFNVGKNCIWNIVHYNTWRDIYD